ncbi:MAG TPA: (2Fe-2S)-binding protein [Anaerolineaceae bacterium]|nr:(2Fe-2S)-binding protein [Anaerolineaceae bacterium]
MTKLTVHFNLNQQNVSLETFAERTLLDVLREDFALTGAKDSCGGDGECGACTVLLDGEAVNACLVLISQVERRHVLTIEGLSHDGTLHPIQNAFVQAGAIQCGYCTPGMVMAAKALLDHIPQPDENQIREALSGNLCRCTGYTKIVQAVQYAASELNHGH